MRLQHLAVGGLSSSDVRLPASLIFWDWWNNGSAPVGLCKASEKSLRITSGTTSFSSLSTLSLTLTTSLKWIPWATFADDPSIWLGENKLISAEEIDAATKAANAKSIGRCIRTPFT